MQLLERSPRGIKLTEAGSRLYEHASRGVEALNEAQQAVMNDETRLKGRLRLSMPPTLIPGGTCWGLSSNGFPKSALAYFQRNGGSIWYRMALTFRSASAPSCMSLWWHDKC